MKKLMKGILVAVIATLLVFGIASCGDNSPNSLAKQMYNTSQKYLRLMESGSSDLERIGALMKKMTTIEEKVQKLSEADQKVFEEELEKLLSKN